MKNFPMPRQAWWMAVVAAILLYAGPVSALPNVTNGATAAGAFQDGAPHVQTRLLVDASQVTPGDSVRVGVLFSMSPQWHIYWQNTGNAGLPTTIHWRGQGLSFGKLHWPAPRVFTEDHGKLVTFGYHGQVLLFTTATVSGDASTDLTIHAAVDYLACQNTCVPGHAKLTQTLALGTQSSLASPQVAKLFDDAAAAVPQPADKLGLKVTTTYARASIAPGADFTASLKILSCQSNQADCVPYDVAYQKRPWAFIPAVHSPAHWRVTGIERAPNGENGWVLHISGKADAVFGGNGAKSAPTARLRGVVHLERANGTRTALLVDQPFPLHTPGTAVAKAAPIAAAAAVPALAHVSKPSTNAAAAATTTASGVGLWKALLLAFLGGILLNLMPCVFPVLAIKLSAFTRIVHESRSHILAHGAAYAGGILGSLLALAGVVIGLRTAGHAVGWGFQFQQPIYVAVLSAILVVFALNLFGVFEVSVRADALQQAADGASGLRRSAWEGVLAVVLATPCSAPFLGTAVGFAMVSSAWVVLAIFAGVGLGLAAPFVVLTLVPGWARVLPKPGPWMKILKQFLGFALLGTVVWLMWIVGHMAGVDAVIRLLAFLGVLGVAAWIYGQVQFSASARRKWGFALFAVLGVAVAATLTLRFGARPGVTSTAPVALANQHANADEISWKPWSQETVQSALRKGRPALVDFSADWCITCQVNEREVLSTPAVRAAIRKYHVATFKGDWTRPDDRIRRKLAQFGKAGVPMYLVYSPTRAHKPHLLPEILTVNTVIKALRHAGHEAQLCGSANHKC